MRWLLVFVMLVVLTAATTAQAQWIKPNPITEYGKQQAARTFSSGGGAHQAQ